MSEISDVKLKYRIDTTHQPRVAYHFSARILTKTPLTIFRFNIICS